MLWFPRCWGTAAAGIKPVLNLMSQNANPSLPRACGQPHRCSQIHSPSLWMHVRGCKLPRGRSGFRVGCLEENHSPGKSKLDEICPSFFLPSTQVNTLRKFSPTMPAGKGNAEQNSQPAEREFSKEWELRSLKRSPNTALGSLLPKLKLKKNNEISGVLTSPFAQERWERWVYLN